MVLYPLLLKPSLHVKVWGGRNLETVMNKPLPSDEPYGESWELHDTCIIENGIYAGWTLQKFIEKTGEFVIGKSNPVDEGMPLLVKLLDASEWLSIQVHPNDAQAQELEGAPRGKTEAWIILAAEPGAKLVIGIKSGTTREEMAAAIENNELEDMLVYSDVTAGDVLYIPANTVHAIGPGILLYEIQQSSDVTYRLYDWGRMGLDGKPRELHIEKGVKVSNLDELPQVRKPTDAGVMTVMVSGEYFITVMQNLTGEQVKIKTAGKFHALTCISGTATIYTYDKSEWLDIETGRTVLVPAGVDEYTLTGNAKVLRSFQNR